jgi:replicative DNA helicase
LTDSPALFNVESERTILGAVLVDNNAWITVSELVKSTDYFDRRNRILHESFELLSESSRPIDIQTVKDALNKLGETLEPGYLGKLLDGIPRISNVGDWCKIVVEKSRRRKAVAIASRLTELAADEGSRIDTTIDSALAEMMALIDSDGQGVDVTIEDAIKQAVSSLEDFVEKDGVTGLPTSLPWLDNITGGMQKGDLFMIAARPTCGKSVLTSQASIAAARAGAKVRICPLEMNPARVARRIILSDAEVDRYLLKRNADLWKNVSRSCGRLSALDIIFDRRPEPTVAQIRASAIRQKKTQGLDLLVVDYLQRMSYDPRLEERIGLGRIARSLKSLASDLDIPVLAAVQINREGELKRPTLRDLAGSGDLEKEADIIFALHPDQETKAMDFPVTRGILLKDRDGAVGEVNLYFEKKLVRFIEEPEGRGLDQQNRDRQE